MPSTPDSATRRGRYLLQPFEVWVASAAVMTGATFFISPSTLGSAAMAAVAEVAPTLAYVWSALYAIGGLSVLFSMCRNSPRLEAAGMCLLAGGITVSTTALLSLRGLQWSTLNLLLVQGGAAVACLVRVKLLWKVARR